jgi:hypothetical protein
MIIGARLRELRDPKKLTQADIEKHRDAALRGNANDSNRRDPAANGTSAESGIMRYETKTHFTIASALR